MTGRDADVVFRDEAVFPEHGVLAYHGHAGDPINDALDEGGTIGDAIASELIVRFPANVQSLIGHRHAELEDIDDVRPIYAVPAWVRELSVGAFSCVPRSAGPACPAGLPMACLSPSDCPTGDQCCYSMNGAACRHRGVPPPLRAARDRSLQE